MTTYPLPTLAAVVSATGITAPAYSDILASLKASYNGIFGTDAYLEADSQDGQLLAVFAQAIYDSNQTAIAVYNQFSPSTAQGAGLSSAVKINGLARLVASNSTVDVACVGTAGTVLTNALVTDPNGYKWALPTATIPVGGSITVTSTCTTIGAINAGAGAVTISTPTRGWQTATFASAASPGNPVEADATLRQRQSVSTALPAQSIIGGVVGAIANTTGVTKYKLYENDTGTADSNGVPAHSMCAVVQGGDAVAIATAIAQKKTPGTGTYGSTTEVIVDPVGVPVTINFYRPSLATIDIAITIKALTGYTSATGTAIIAALVAYINSLGIAANNGLLSRSALYAAAYSVANSNTFNITTLNISIDPASPTSADLTIGFNVLPISATGNVALTVI